MHASWKMLILSLKIFSHFESHFTLKKKEKKKPMKNQKSRHLILCFNISTLQWGWRSLPRNGGEKITF